MKSIILVSSLLFSFLLKAQNYYQFSSGKFQTEKVTVVKVSEDTISVKLYFYSSERCACEETETFKLAKNEVGDYAIHPYDDESKIIQANVYDGKVKSILIKSSWDGPCCNINSGIFIQKPTPPAGSTTVPKVTSLNAAPKRFLDFWTDFQSKMNNTDSIIPMISFPYIVDCNYLDVTKITLSDFKENGVEVFFNGNAFISHTFSTMNYPKNKGLYFGKFMDGYLSETVSSFITANYTNLDNVYVVSELINFEQIGGYKAYFIESNGTFKFIGFEGIEQGD